jgi:RNA polymerase sigma factor (sigma-70 family)
MVLNEFLSWRRRRRAVTVGPLTLEAISASRPEGHEPAADHLEQRDAMVSLIAALPPRQRAVLALRYYEDCADAEIARLMGCSEATVRSHASRAS